MTMVPLVVLSMFLSHCYACQYFSSDEFKAKAPTYKLRSAPQKCKEEVKGYANRAVLAIVDNNGGLCTNAYFITKYYCSKKCNELCPDMVDKKMLYVFCNKFEMLDEEGATADQVGFSCKCKYIGVPGFCEVPQTTWDVVEEEYETSCLADVSVAIDEATSTTPIAATTTETPPTSPSTTAIDYSTSSTPPAGTQSTVAATTSDDATSPADATESPAPNTTVSLAPSTSTEPPTTTTATPADWETLTDHLFVGPILTEQVTDTTLDVCEQMCLGEYAGLCKAYQLVIRDDGPLGECWVMSQTRFDAPIDFLLPADLPPGFRNTYVGLCNGPAAECGAPPTDSQFV